MQPQPLEYYIDAYLAGTITTGEWTTLQALLNDPENMERLNVIMDRQLADRAAAGEQYPDAVARIRTALLNRIGGLSVLPAGQATPVRAFYRRSWFRYAAAVAILLAAAIIYFVRAPSIRRNDQLVQATVKKTATDVAPGGNKAVLTLADGSVIVLDSASNGTLAQQAGATIQKTADGTLLYSANGANTTHMPVYNTITTPRGGKYQLGLPDGSQVWLNAASSITFPTAFTGNTRQVSITGEAYFEIKKNRNQPFTILARSARVDVLGTDFNVSAYDDETALRVALLSGSVNVTRGETVMQIKPGQEAIVTSSDLRLNQHPDMEKAISWKNDEFIFEHDDINSIMRQLARWYDIEPVVEKPSERRYIGKISRSVPLSEVLGMFEKLGYMHFDINGKKVTVTPIEK